MTTMTTRTGGRSSTQPGGRGVTGLVSRTWWRVRDYTDAVRWQALALDRRYRPQDLARPEGDGTWRAVDGSRPVVLVPGVYEAWSFMRPLADRLRARGLTVHAVPDLRFNRAPIARQASLLGRFLEDEDLRDVLLVAHSKGGLIGKVAMLRHDPQGRIARMVSLNTPYDGSVLAWAFPTRAVLALRPTEPTLQTLGAERSVNHRITAVRSVWDPHVPAGSSLNGDDDRVAATPGHFRPLLDPAFVDLITAVALRSEAGGAPD